MLSNTGTHFGAGFGGTSVVTMLAAPPVETPIDLKTRLSRVRAPAKCRIGGRDAMLKIGGEFRADNVIALPVLVGENTCRLHLSPELVQWLAQPLGLSGSLPDEEPMQRALLLEAASLDLVSILEKHLEADIRFGEGTDADADFSVDATLIVDERALGLRLDLPETLAQALADALDRIDPPKPDDLSGHGAELVIEAGSQDLTVEELESLQPGDIVMLASHRPLVVADRKLVAPARTHAGGFELTGPFSPRAGRASAVGEAIVTVAFEFGRVAMTLGGIDALKPGTPLPVAHVDEVGVDIVVADKRVGRGELVAIGSGLGVRIHHLLPAAPDDRTS